MESIRDVVHMVKQGVWMASVDLHHAYYSVSIHAPHRPYLPFFWQGTYYHYLRLPIGYAQAPLLFTKLLRLPFGSLWSQGHLSVVYMDDFYLQEDSVFSCRRNVSATVSLLQALGFNINERKSVLTPTQSLEFLGFIISSTAMTLTLTPRRKSNIAEVCNKEWALKDAVFALLPTAYVSPVIDLFASSANAKLPRYISWLLDPHAYAVDAFTVSWQDLTFYAFPPFSLLPRVLGKIIQDKATGLLIVPKWTTQSWFPLVLTLLIQHPRLIAPCRDLLYLPKQPQVVHPLHKKLSLLAVLLSGMPSRVSAYRTQLRPSSRNPGVLELGCSMTPFSEDGRGFVLDGKSIPCLPLS